ncbi:MAG TPA: hypothetical protein VLH38_00995 [Patescibacteria group bacterium]|nr:hypothetical protein [Patescibacteria group bacterium]
MIFILLGAMVLLALLAAAYFLFWRKRPQQLKTDYYQKKWLELQGLLRDKSKWSEAILDADKLLEMALKKKHIQGHTMGERLVKAQRLFTDNDSVWFGHKLRNRIDADPKTKLKETEVKQALLGIRRALKDVGALPNGQSTDSK